MSTRRLAESVEGLNTSLTLTAGDFWPKTGRPIAAVKGIKTQKPRLNRKKTYREKILAVATLIVTHCAARAEFLVIACMKRFLSMLLRLMNRNVFIESDIHRGFPIVLARFAYCN